MLRAVSILAIVFSGCFVHAQEIVFCNNRMNIVYANVENPMSVAVDGIPCRLLVVQSKDGVISDQNGCKFTFKPSTEDLVAFIEVSRKKGSTNVKIGKVSFRVQRLKMITLVGSLVEREAEKNTLMAMGGIRVVLEHPVDYRMAIVEYKVIVQKDNEIAMFNNSGARFSQELLTGFSKLMVDDIVLIYDVKVRHPNGRVEIATPVSYHIK